MSPSSPNPEVSQACTAAAAAFSALSRLSPDHRAALLDAIAAALDARRSDILATCAEETALTIDELTPELARMTGTLGMFADLIREGSWVRAAIDTQNPRGNAGATETSQAQRSTSHHPAHPPNGPGVTAGVPHAPPLIGPNHGLRSMLVPLGPVAVFGSSNFPLAYGVCGGDTASALAAGCPVIVKEHPAHPRTGRLLASIAQQATQNPRGHAGATEAAPRPPTHAPRGPGVTAGVLHALQYLHNEDPRDFSIAQQLVQSGHIAAVGFTGSIPGGLAIETLARERHVPIPVFAEMGSNNLIFISGGAAAARRNAIADEIAASILQRFGQQCTCPGTIVVEPGDAGSRLVDLLAERIGAAHGRDMLAPWIKSTYERRLAAVQRSGVVRVLAQGESRLGLRGSFACLLYAGDDYTSLVRAFEHDTLRDEIFGPAAVVVRLPMDMVFELRPHGSLTCSVYAEPTEIRADWTLAAAISTASARAGRIIFNGPPTGVRVATSMVHGGPYPATNAPHTTAVGPRAIERFCRPICFQNCPDTLLPPELQNANPRNLWRTINGALTRAPI